MHHKYFNHTLALLRKNSFLYKVTIRYRKINQIKINTSFNHMSILVTFFLMSSINLKVHILAMSLI